MPTMTSPRREGTTYRNSRNSDVQRHYREYSQNRSSAAKAYDYPETFPTYRPYKPTPYPGRTEQAKSVQEKKSEKKTGSSTISGKNLLSLVFKIGIVFILCYTMIYRYAIILESNDRITKMQEEYAKIEAANQAIQFKIDRGLELGALEEYATKQLGMMRPDTSQVFYIDMQLGDEAASGSEADSEDYALQGTPGALVHAIQVLK